MSEKQAPAARALANFVFFVKNRFVNEKMHFMKKKKKAPAARTLAKKQI